MVVKMVYSLECHCSVATCSLSSLCLSAWQLLMMMLLLGQDSVMQMWMTTSTVSLGISLEKVLDLEMTDALLGVQEVVQCHHVLPVSFSS